METTNHVLTESHSTEENSHWILQPGQKLMAGEVLRPREESVAVDILNGHDVPIK